MACIKEVNRSASVAMSPDAPYMAAGTMAGAVDLSFSSSANLEIFKLDFQSDSHELPLVGGSPSSERFNRIAWSKNSSHSEEFSLGLIAGGLVDGKIDIWNPLALISPQGSESALVGHLSRHKGPVRGLGFNSIAPNLLASGADDGEICIWDLAKPAEPIHYPPLKSSGSTAQGEISYISWNSKVQHILASTSYNGITVVWDLKKQKQAMNFSDSVRRRCSVLQWHPDLATQLIVASDDDSSPSLRLWDMRNPISPVKEFVGHTRGVMAMEWCPNDSSYLLTCAKDNRTICWDTISGEIVCELPTGTNWNFDVHWYPKIPGVISASSFDGRVGIYNIEGCSRYGATESNYGSTTLRAPKWYKRPVGVSFGFGGKLVSFHSKPSPGGGSGGASEVVVNSLITEQSLVSRSSEFEAAVENGERSSLRALCDKKSQDSESEEDKETWGFLKVMLNDDGTARTKLLSHLGFNLPIKEKDTAQDGISPELNAIGLADSVADDKIGLDSNKDANVFALDSGEDFFNNLPSPKADTPVSTSANNFTTTDSAASAEESQPADELEEDADLTFCDAVQRALVVGDYNGAVALCLSANRMADALVIAHTGGIPLWETTRDHYLKTSRSPYMKVISAMVNNDLTSLVKTRPLMFWKETLALLCTFAQGEEWTILCDTLASKLRVTGNILAATLCYICSGNIDKTVEIWSRSLACAHEGKSYVDLLQDLMEKTIVLALATGHKQFSSSLCKLVENYAELLASQGLLTTAMKYLKLLGSDDLSPELAIVRDRIALSAEPVKEIDTVVLDNSQLQSEQQYYQNTATSQGQQSYPSNVYGDDYQQKYNPSYGGGYVPPNPYAPTQQSTMFLPPQAQQVPQTSFASPVSGQASMRTTFVPSNPPGLRNAEQYQQPTLGSQLYPGSVNPSYHAPTGSAPNIPLSSHISRVPGANIPQVLAPTSGPTGFVPGVAARPVLGSMHPPSPQLATTQLAAAPAAPPPTVQTADTANVPAHQKPIIQTLTRLFNETSQALGGSRANPAKKREIEDNSRKLGALFAKLNSGDISKNAADKLGLLCQALENNDFGTALQIQVLLTTTEWDECNFWLATVKRMIKTRQNVR